jgi:hypothetical protein
MADVPAEIRIGHPQDTREKFHCLNRRVRHDDANMMTILLHEFVKLMLNYDKYADV